MLRSFAFFLAKGRETNTLNKPAHQEQPDSPRRVTPEMNDRRRSPPRRGDTKIAQHEALGKPPFRILRPVGALRNSPSDILVHWERTGVSGDRSYIFIRGAALILIFATLFFAPPPAHAHVGSPDIYAEGSAGPYKLFVTIRPPLVIPGVAEIEVRAEGAASDTATISNIQITPIPLTGEASHHPPVADQMKQSAQDKLFFTGALWIMASGSWQVRFMVNGSRGQGVLSIPVPATSSSTLGMNAGLGIILGSLGLLLVAGVVGIVGAAVRDAQLPPGSQPSTSTQTRAWISMAVALVVMIAAVWFGNKWWKGEADNYALKVYKPLTMQADLGPDQVLHLKIKDPGWLKSRRIDDFVLDHDHLMHLYLIREPGLDVVYHLHPDLVAPGKFQLALPSIPAGTYTLYADVVHATGFPETLVTRITLPEIAGRPLAGDDAKGQAQPLASTPSTPNTCPGNPAEGPRFHLPDNYTMVWNNPATLPAKTPQVFEFSLLGPDGKPAPDTALYMGMLGHAAFVKDDGSVFAHVHPSGTVSMAALMMAAAQNQANQNQANQASQNQGNQPSQPNSATMTSMPSMPGMSIPASSNPSTALPNSVGFPYGFPTAGPYRIFVQMKHSQTIETAAFDACAAPPTAN